MENQRPSLELMLQYFELIEREFGDFTRDVTHHGGTPDEVARAILGSTAWADRIACDVAPRVCTGIRSFWEQNGSLVLDELRGLPVAVARFGGDIGPQQGEISRTGAYFDTIAVPDPLLNIATKPPPIYRARDLHLVKYAVSLLAEKDLYLAWIPTQENALTDPVFFRRSRQ